MAVVMDADRIGRSLARIAHEAGVALNYVTYPAPQPLEQLWSRPDLGAVFMCGFPFVRARPQPRLRPCLHRCTDRLG